MEYNLLKEKWIPILGINGTYEYVDIKTAFTDAHQIRQIAYSNPMDRFAIFRFLLTILYWCKGNPPQNRLLTSAKSFPVDWFNKLDDNCDFFNLFGNLKRFYQNYPSDNTKIPEKLSANYLIQEVPTGTNHYHFRHSVDNNDGLCPSCCTIGLLRLPLFTTSGGRGKPPGINSKPPIYQIPVGTTLAETLWLSWKPVKNIGLPVWELPEISLSKVSEISLLTGMTWVPRRVWLDNPTEPQYCCISCGKNTQLVRQCIFAGIGSTKTEDDEPARNWQDPHVIYSTFEKGKITSLHASDALGSKDSASDQWSKNITGLLKEESINSLETMIETNNINESKVKIWMIGFSTVKNDKYLEAREFFISSPLSLNEPTKSIDEIERWQKECRKIGKRLDQLTRSRVSGDFFSSSIRPQIENNVSENADKMLSGDINTWEKAANEYQPMMKMVANSISPGYTTVAIKRRKDIADIKPDIHPKENLKNNIKKKGSKE